MPIINFKIYIGNIDIYYFIRIYILHNIHQYNIRYFDLRYYNIVDNFYLLYGQKLIFRNCNTVYLNISYIM